MTHRPAGVPAPDPYAHLDQLDRLTPRIEALADEYRRLREPLYDALRPVGRIPDCGSDEWAQAVWRGGRALISAELERVPARECERMRERFGDRAPTEVGPDDRSGWVLFELLAAAVRDDRPDFDRRFARYRRAVRDVAAMPGTARNVVAWLNGHTYRRHAPGFCRRLRDLADEFGAPYSLFFGTVRPGGLDGVTLSPAAADALDQWRAWLPDRPDWVTNGCERPPGRRDGGPFGGEDEPAAGAEPQRTPDREFDPLPDPVPNPPAVGRLIRSRNRNDPPPDGGDGWRVVWVWKDDPGEDDWRPCLSVPESDGYAGFGPPPAVCTWLPAEWPGGPFPLGPSVGHIRDWAAVVRFWMSAPGVVEPDDDLLGFRTLTRCVRSLARHRKVLPATRRGEPLPDSVNDARREVLAILDELAAGPTDEAYQYVTLDQAAAMVSRSKKTLEREMHKQGSDAPEPDVEGGGGRPHEWRWDRIRSWLIDKYRKELPEVFPRQ